MRLRRIGELFVRRLAVKKFKVTIEGKNLLLNMEGVRRRQARELCTCIARQEGRVSAA